MRVGCLAYHIYLVWIGEYDDLLCQRLLKSPKNRPYVICLFCFTRSKNEKMGTVTINTIHTEPKQIKSLKGEKIHELLNFFLNGLRKRSRYLLGVSDHSQTGRHLYPYFR